jgi:hypothetical protein
MTNNLINDLLETYPTGIINGDVVGIVKVGFMISFFKNNQNQQNNNNIPYHI